MESLRLSSLEGTDTSTSDPKREILADVPDDETAGASVLLFGVKKKQML